MYAYRNTRAHNSILVNGMGQKIGTEGYGWIPRFYEGEELSYVVGDASNAYGKVTSPLWLERGRLSGTKFTPENGWDENKLDCFRRHIVQLGRTGLFVVYDELVAKEPVKWSYLLHTIEQPMEVTTANDGLRIAGKNNSDGVSVANLFSSQEMTYAQTDTFFVAAINWKKRLDNVLSNHYHFTATTTPCKTACFLNILDVHGDNRQDLPVVRQGNKITVAGWTIECNLDTPDTPYLYIENKQSGASLRFDYKFEKGATIIEDKVKDKTIRKRLVDYLPEFDI